MIRSVLFILIGITIALGEYLGYYQFNAVGRIASLVFYIPTIYVFGVAIGIFVIKILRPLLNKIMEYYWKELNRKGKYME